MIRSIMEMKDFRSLSPEAQEDIRKKAVKGVLAGNIRTDIVKLFQVIPE